MSGILSAQSFSNSFIAEASLFSAKKDRPWINESSKASEYAIGIFWNGEWGIDSNYSGELRRGMVFPNRYCTRGILVYILEEKFLKVTLQKRGLM